MPTGPSNRLRSVVVRSRRRASTALKPRRRPRGDAAVLLASGLFDPWYYGLQLRKALDPGQAAAHYLSTGARDGLNANPLTDFSATGMGSEEIIRGLLDGSARTYPVRSYFDASGLVAAFPNAAQHAGGPVGYYLENAHAGRPVPSLGTRTWISFRDLRQRQSRAARTIVASGLFDREYYELQVGSRFASDLQALWHYLEVGEPQRLSPNPLFETDWYYRTAGRKAILSFAHFVRTGQTEGEAGPHFDGRSYLTRHPEAAEHPGGPLGHFLAHADDNTDTCPRDGNGVLPAPWSVLRAKVLAAATEYGAQRRLILHAPTRWAPWFLATATPPEEPRDDTVAILADARAWNDDPDAVRTLLDQHHQNWRLRLAVDPDDEPPAAAAGLGERVQVVRTNADTWAERANALVASVDEPWVTTWQPGERWSPSLLSGLLTATASGTGAYAAAFDEPESADDDVTWWCELPTRAARLWAVPRSLAGMLVPASVLHATEGPFRPAAVDRYAWDFLLRVDPPMNYVPFAGVSGPDLGDLPGIPGVRSTVENTLRADQLIDWVSLQNRLDERVDGRVSLLIPTYRDWQFTRRAVSQALEWSEGDVEVVVVDNGSRREVTSLLTSLFAADPRVRVLRVPRNTNLATGSNLAFAASTGTTVVFLNNDTEPRQGWLSPLVASLGSGDVIGAQPLLLYPDDSIQTAGTVFYGKNVIPGHLLASHPSEDCPTEPLTLKAVTAACMAVSAELVSRARGFDPVYVNGMEDVDLCLRLVEATGGHFTLVPQSRVAHHESKSSGRFARSETNRILFLDRWGDRLPEPEAHLWRASGFDLTALPVQPPLLVSGRRTAVTPVLARPGRTVQDGPAAGLPRLRWALKIAAPGGPRGDVWGDAAFASDLANALRYWGQEVVVDRHDAHQRPPSDYLDDVALTIRGLDKAHPLPGATNLLWVISHPDDVALDELGSDFDLVYSAGPAWAEKMSRSSGREIRPLLQATDPARFNPAGPALAGLDIVFVGRTRRVFRPIIRDAVAAGADLSIFGDGWAEYVDARWIAAEHLPNDQLPEAYRGARVVLNDHWSDMARLGFLSNRLFDAAAAGARIVSDPVPGLEGVFGPSVSVYRTVDELRDLLDPTSRRWQDDEVVAENARLIAARHSFSERARTLLSDVLDVRGVPHRLR